MVKNNSHEIEYLENNVEENDDFHPVVKLLIMIALVGAIVLMVVYHI